jgi:inorganic pyrophosphatase
VRLIGIIEAEQIQDGKTEINNRLLGVAVHSYDHEDIDTMGDVSKTLLSQVEEFFVSYNRQRGKKFRITGTGGPKKTLKALKEAMKAKNDAKDK